MKCVHRWSSRLLPLLLLALCSLPLLAGCQTPAAAVDDELQGRILLWHSWDEENTAVLASILDQFRTIHPNVTIISVAVPPEELRQRFASTAVQGLGPDLFIGSSDWIPELVRAGLLEELSVYDVSVLDFGPTVISDLRVNDGLYGLPLSLRTVALYYNASLVDTPAQSISELRNQANDGQTVALPTDFAQAYWGIGAYGPGLFRDGVFNLVESGLLAWLTQLKAAQEAPGVIMDNDSEALLRLFAEERVAYFIGGSDALPLLQEAIGADDLGVAVLPGGPNGPAAPLLSIEAVMLNSASSADQRAAALSLAAFLTNAEQSNVLLREAGRIPANWRVQVDSRIYPILAPFALQSRAGVTLPNTLDKEAFIMLGDTAYSNMLGGVLTPEEAVCEFGIAVVDLEGVDVESAVLPDTCTQ